MDHSSHDAATADLSMDKQHSMRSMLFLHANLVCLSRFGEATTESAFAGRLVVVNLFDLGGAPNLSPPYTPASMSANAKVTFQ